MRLYKIITLTIFLLLNIGLSHSQTSCYVVNNLNQITIPVIVHVVYQTEEQNISDKLISSQIEVLNQDFNCKNIDLNLVPKPFKKSIGNPNIQFELKFVYRVKTFSSSFFYLTNYYQPIKNTSLGGHDVIEPEKYLNIWVCNLINNLGYAQFPGEDSIMDGVVINYKCFGKNSLDSVYNLGRTTTHEIGHWLGLNHPWYMDCCGNDDYCNDTPVQLGPVKEYCDFPVYDSLNTTYPGIMINNFMEYGDDKNLFFFTKDQVSIMRVTLMSSRKNLQ